MGLGYVQIGLCAMVRLRRKNKCKMIFCGNKKGEANLSLLNFPKIC